jgi:protein SCO1/2
MEDISRRSLLGLLGMAPLAGAMLSGKAGAAGVARATGDKKPSGWGVPLSQAAARDKIRDRYFPDVTLYNQNGKRVRLYEDLVKGKIVTLSFFYANCEGICPQVTANMVKVQKLLAKHVGRDLFMNSFSLKPEEDTPDKLKEYEQMHGIGPGWNLLTGKPNDLELVRKSLGFTYPQKAIDQDKSQHIGNVRYGNEPLMLWSACPGMAHASWIAESISWVIRDEKG